MQNIGHIIDDFLSNHIYKIIVIHWISCHTFEQPGQGIRVMTQTVLDLLTGNLTVLSTKIHKISNMRVTRINDAVLSLVNFQIKYDFSQNKVCFLSK